MSRTPRISILIPLQDEREAGVDCLRAWTGGQTAEAESYELVAVAIGEDASLEQAVRPLLREHDRWIERPGIDEYEAYDVGAEAATGEFVFLTEAHCVPERECLSATLEELDRNGTNGVRIKSVPETRGAFGALELEGVRESEQAEEDADHWRKVLIHGIAIRRDVYLDAGGVPSRYGDFAPWVLSMSLNDRGQRPTFSPRPRVSHVYDGDFGKMQACVRSFMAGEVRYREEHPAPSTDVYLGWSGEWEGRLEHTRSGARRALWAGLRLRRGAAGSLARHLAVTVLGPRASIAAARRGAARAARRARGSQDPESRRQSFREFWLLTSRRGRLEGIAQASNGLRPAAAADRVDLTETMTGQVIGFHQPEHPAGEPPFRWTAPLSLLRVKVPGDGLMKACLELRPMQRAAEAEPRIAVDGRPIVARVRDEAIEFELQSGDRWIAIGTRALRPREHCVDDARALGLPVRSLSFEPAGAESGR